MPKGVETLKSKGFNPEINAEPTKRNTLSKKFRLNKKRKGKLNINKK
jgi:hypothetical protein